MTGAGAGGWGSSSVISMGTAGVEVDVMSGLDYAARMFLVQVRAVARRGGVCGGSGAQWCVG